MAGQSWPGAARLATRRLKGTAQAAETEPVEARDGSCIRLRPERPNHVWWWDFVLECTDDGRPVKLMVVIDEYTRQCLAIQVTRRVRSLDAIEVFSDLIEVHGIPEHIRADNGPR